MVKLVVQSSSEFAKWRYAQSLQWLGYAQVMCLESSKAKFKEK